MNACRSGYHREAVVLLPIPILLLHCMAWGVDHNKRSCNMASCITDLSILVGRVTYTCTDPSNDDPTYIGASVP